MVEPGAGDASDPALVARVAAGSEDALAALYDRHVPAVYGTALRLTGDRGTAEEVVQETFLALWNRADVFDPALASLATWLRAIARNRALDRLRAAGRRPALVPLGGSTDGDDDPGLERLPPDLAVIGGAGPDPAPEDAAEAADLRARIREVLAGMPEPERTVIVLAYREELTQQEIATRLGWPLGTVKTRTRRALARLRARLEEDGPDGGSTPGGEDDDGPR